MLCLSQLETPALPGKTWPFFRRCLCYATLALGVVAVLHALFLEPYQIPTGSMAPTLRGHHRVCQCPRCGHEIVVGRSASDTEGSGQSRHYRKAFCPNCGLVPVSVSDTPEVQGNRVLVNKSAFLVRSPRRWEIVVFRLLGIHYIKRLLGLPGEEILIQDGDLYVNGELVRKTLDEVKAMRILVFDQQFAPQPEGWKCRWERVTPQTLTYRNFILETGKCEPLRDEYSYNGGLHADSECVHDFMIDTEIEVVSGCGSLALRLCDGHDWAEVRIPVAEESRAEAFCWSVNGSETMKKLGESDEPRWLRPQRRYRVELALVDRRLTLAIDARVWLSLDLPTASKRMGVDRPFQMQTEGVEVRLRSFQLYRDVHYGQQGRNGVHGKSVRLGGDQYFVLGDNSPNSQDSRFLADEGRLPGNCLVGSAWLVYGSSPLRRLP